LSIDADQVVLGIGTGHALLEKLAKSSAVGDFDLIGESAAVIVQKENLHGSLLLKVKMGSLEKKRIWLGRCHLLLI
jgi:hypothetical protein